MDDYVECVEYLGYRGTVEWSVEDRCYYGKILRIKDLVMYDAPTKELLVQEFKDCVESYILFTKNTAEMLYTKEDLERAYKQGWIACTGWADRDDLIADIDSQAYESGRDARLQYWIMNKE